MYEQRRFERMNASDRFKWIVPKPPEFIDTKSLGVWHGWSKIGDREAAREAATKGTHINLVIKFLSSRNDLDINEAEKWFKDEIHCWVLHLLTRNQVFKASHILNNIKVDPISEMMSIFSETSCKELRENVGNHLLKNEKLEDKLINCWTLLKSIENNYDMLFSLKEKYIVININLINEQTEDWKKKMGTELFFQTFDFSLELFVQSDYAWRYLLKSNVNLVKLWINVRFGNTLIIEICDINIDIETIDKLNNLFSKLPITQNMIDLIPDENLKLSEQTQSLTLNELSIYGIFSTNDKNELIVIIKRLLETNNIENINKIFKKANSNINLNYFCELLINYCVENKLYSVLNVCLQDFMFSNDMIKKVNSKYLEIILNIRNLYKHLDNESFIRGNIFEVANLLFNGNLYEFTSVPIIVLSLIVFSKGISIYELLSNKVSIKIKDFEINAEVMLSNLEGLPFFKTLYNKFIGVSCTNSLTYYDLLSKHTNLNVNRVYDFRFISSHIPHFNLTSLVQKYGYHKEINYMYFVKQCRPSYACKIFILNRLDLDLLELKVACNKTYKLAINNFLRYEITTSCLTFLEMMGVDSHVLRLFIKVANIIYNSGQINELLIKDWFNNIETNCENIFNLLEQSVVNNINLNKNSTGLELTNALKTYNIVVKFSLIHNLKLPELFLKYCTENDLWLPFLIYIQIYQYPYDVICKLVHNFNSVPLMEHLSHCVLHDVQPDDAKSQLMGERDSRKNFLSRIGFRISDGTIMQTSPEVSLASYSSYGSMSTIGSDFLESETLDFKTDVLQTLIRCHNNTDPPKALLYAARYYKCPIMTVLANSYEPDSIIINWITWLIVSCDLDGLFPYYDGFIIAAESIIELFRRVLQKCYFKTLRNSFSIFFPDSPLKVFMDFLNDCIQFNFDFKLLKEKLVSFNKQIKCSRNNSCVSEIDSDMGYFNNKLWMQKAALLLLSMVMQHAFKSRHDQIRFLDVLIRLEITKYFYIQCPNFDTILTLLRYISENIFNVNLDLSLIYNEDKFVNEVKRYINELVTEKRYINALNVAKIVSISPDFILIQEIKDEFATRNQKKFWVKWNEVFTDLQISPTSAVNFYVECAEKIENKLEKYEVLKLAHRWAHEYKLHNLFDVEESMWLTYFCLDNCLKKIEPIHTDCFLYDDFLKELKDAPVKNITLNEMEMESFEKAVEDLLNFGDLYTALRLEYIFGYKQIDLNILKLCLRLAEGILLPYHLNPQERLLLNKRSNARNLNTRRRKYISTKASSFSSVSYNPNAYVLMHITDNVIAPLQDILALLEMLADNLKNGLQIALKIQMTYRISTKIHKSYQEVIECKDPMKMLHQAFKMNCENKLEILGDFAHVFELSKGDIADFICEEIVNAATEYSKSSIDISFLWDMNADTDFNLILQLLPDNCTILGLKLYSYASALHKSHAEAGTEFKLNEIVLVIELLIRSHDCFTADCNMEGISIILKKSQVIISLLIHLQNWKLIVRLLTGIARYTEMNYIFHILRENGQFELLLRKGSHKDNGLKVALLEYLKKYCPDDIELYKIVALHFFLFSEIAALWEEEAETIIRRLIALSKLEMQNNKINPEMEEFVLFTSNDDMKKFLTKVMNNYKHAAEYHLHGEKLAKAMNATKQAQLLALQLSLLKDSNDSTCPCLLNLSDVQISTLISSHLNFPQTLILVEAYNYQVDWATILYEQYLVKNNTQYLNNFMSAFPLTETLVKDISRKFLSSRIVSASLIANMKNVLNKLPFIHTKYRITSELGFSDLLEDLLDGNRLAFLKDTVWKKGYKD